MGSCQSYEEKRSNRFADSTNEKVTETKSTEPKLLLLGASECGKSTILKQMRIMHNSFTDVELMQQRWIVSSNILMGMLDILTVVIENNMGFAQDERQVDYQKILNIIRKGNEFEPITTEVADSLQRLWADPTVQMVYSQRTEYHLSESFAYFMENLYRIKSQCYMPTKSDILMMWVKTVGIAEVDFTIQGSPLRVIDVGGQKSERKKWIHCFEEVSAIIYIVAISEYDEASLEDEDSTRLLESLQLFETICCSFWFQKTSMIVFLNKIDLFTEKIKFKSIEASFPEYEGAQTYEDSIAYIRERFEALHRDMQKAIFSHEVCAIDTGQVRFVLHTVVSMVIRQNLQKTNLF